MTAVVLVETAALQDSASHSRVPEAAAAAAPENLLEMDICGPQPSLIKSKTWSPAKQRFNETSRGF